MGQDPDPRNTKGRHPALSEILSSRVTREKSDDGSDGLIGFAPSPTDADLAPPASFNSKFLARQRLRRRVLVLGILILIGGALVYGPDFYRGLKAWRAAELARQGEDWMRKGQMEEAISNIRAGYMLSPNNPEVIRAMAMMLTTFNSPDAVTYWNWLLETREATDEDRRDAAECNMSKGFYHQAFIIIQDLLKRSGGDARNQLLAAKWSTQRGTPDETMHFATNAVNDDSTYKPAILFLAVQQLSNPYLHQNGVDTLFKLADADDNFGLMAMRCLILDPKLKPAEIDHLTARLRSHALAGEAERLAALSFEIGRHPDQRAALIEQAMVAHEKVSPTDLALFAQWLSSNHEAARVLTLISREHALSDKDLFSAYIDALGVLKRWAELKEVLSGASIPIEAPIVELYLSRCATEMGDEEASEHHWQNALAAAHDDPSLNLRLAMYAEKHGQPARAAAVYRILTQQPITARIAYEGLWRVVSDRDLEARCSLLDEIATRWPRDTEMVSEDICLNLLLNRRVTEMHQMAVDILATDANSISHLTNVALSCLRLKDPAGALNTYQHISIDWNHAPVIDVVVYAATLKANGQTRAAHHVMLLVDRDALRPELKELLKST